jgi:hypothetical protein
MLLRDLVAHPGLGLRLLHGPGTALERPVRWVCTTDLIDPSRYLSGGELVVSGLVWRREPADSDRFVAALAASGCAALAAGTAVFGSVPGDVVDACRRHGVPLIEVPEETSFSAVTELVVGALAAARGDRLAHSLGRQRRLLSAVAGGMGLDELVAQVSADTGLVCRVLSATGRGIVAGPRPLTGAELDRIAATFLTVARLPAVVRCPDPARDGGAPAAGGRSVGPSGTHSVFGVGPASEQRATSWLVAVEGAFPTWDTSVAEAVDELVAIAALDRARRGEGLRLARDIADDAVALVAGGAGNRPETATRLRQAGLDPTAPLTVVVAGFVDRPDRLEIARAVLADAASHVGSPVVGRHDGLAVALLPGDAAPLRTALARLEPGLGPDRLTVGVSRPSGPDALAGALGEARHARDLAEHRPGVLHVVTGADVTSHVALHCSGSWSRAARRLHLHVNTVRYRIGRVEELTGRDLGVFTDRVDVFLALRSR